MVISVNFFLNASLLCKYSSPKGEEVNKKKRFRTPLEQKRRNERILL